MDDRLEELLDRAKTAAAAAGKTAGATARYAGEKAGGLVEVSRQKVRAFELESEIKGLLRQVGESVYHTLSTGESREEKLEELTECLDEKHAALEQVKDEISRLRDEKECPACGASCGRDDRYCRACGAAL
ncbi:MAG: zinc ribbon domain-containing protein [Clostridiales bacterium]|nr:zinc ribbon domain-containing protein [Clostridiales bacterium]MDY4181751.1 zinc ribbon domain-containing protein [Pseudoflavonifractor sp.]